MSHFLEHLAFKGTPERTAREIAEEIDAVGGDMNAYTTKEYTTFYVRALAEHVELGLDILCDILCRPALRPEEVDAERQVILEEVLMHRDEPMDVVQEHFATAMFPSHPLGREVLGEPEVIRKVTVPAIRSFFDQHYLPGNMVIAAAGDLDHDRLAVGIEARFASRQGGRPPVRRAPSQETVPLVVESRETEQAQLVLGVRAPDRHSADRFALAVLNHTLGGGLSSRLFQEIREARGLAYSIGSDRNAYDDAGALAISVGTAPEHAHEVLDLLHLELDRLGAEGITERELEVAKGHLRADMLLSLEDSGSRMSRIGSALLLFGTVLTAEELIGRIAAVTADQVRNVAERVLTGPRTLAVVGPFVESDFV
jgi:predicted Zn-dependent peptidase